MPYQDQLQAHGLLSEGGPCPKGVKCSFLAGRFGWWIVDGAGCNCALQEVEEKSLTVDRTMEMFAFPGELSIETWGAPLDCERDNGACQPKCPDCSLPRPASHALEFNANHGPDGREGQARPFQPPSPFSKAIICRRTRVQFDPAVKPTKTDRGTGGSMPPWRGSPAREAIIKNLVKRTLGQVSGRRVKNIESHRGCRQSA